MGYLVSGEFECCREDQPTLRLLILWDHIVLARADPLGPALSLNRKWAILVDGKEGLILFQFRKDLFDDPHFSVVLGIVAGEDNLGLPPFESGGPDENTYTFSRRAMTTVSHNSVKIIHPPGGSVKAMAQRLKHMRWPLLRRGSRVRGRARQKLDALLASKMATARAWELKETFFHFWRYKSVTWAEAFLDYWCYRAMRSRLDPMKKVARMLRAHEALLLNWFRAKGEISAGAVEGLNNKIRVVTRRSYGFRTYNAMEMALYHTLGRLPEPESAHKFC